MVDTKGVPLAVIISAANTYDSKKMLHAIDALEPIRSKRPGRPRMRPKKLHADKGYDYQYLRDELKRRTIEPRIARRGIESKEHLGRHR